MAYDRFDMPTMEGFEHAYVGSHEHDLTHNMHTELKLMHEVGSATHKHILRSAAGTPSLCRFLKGCIYEL